MERNTLYAKRTKENTLFPHSCKNVRGEAET
jgi:hypothetical protein